jgi:hypothetical protein
MAAGGYDTNGPLSSVDLYNPSTGAWTPAAPLTTPRASHTATLLPNGTVLVAGGLNANPLPTLPPLDTVLASAEIYDPVTGNWTTTGSMGQPRQAHSATLLPNGKLMVAGGVSYFGSVFPTSCELYDPASGKWRPALPLTSGRTDHIAALLPDGKVIVAGGFNTSDSGPSTELFDPASAVATPASLTLAKLSDGATRIAFRDTPGIGFTVLTTTDLTKPISQWTVGGSALEISPGHYQFIDLPAAHMSQRFYRVRSP